MKKCTQLLFSWMVIVFFFSPQSKASHIVGVDIRYEPVGPCTYRMYVTQYYDCLGNAVVGNIPVSTAPPPVAPGSKFSISGVGACSPPTLVGSWILSSYEEVTPLCPSVWNQPGLHPTGCDGFPLNPNPFINGIAATVYQADFNFCNSNCSIYTLAYNDCCRNSIITSGAADDGIFIQAVMNLDSLNTSPVYASDPVFLLCNDGLIQVPLSGIDPDGDSLAYSLGPCIQDLFGAQVGYNMGYSPQAPLGPTWNVSLNSQTGILSLTPSGSGPGAQVVGVACVEVKEYRNGVLVGVSNRDFQITILPNCSNSTPSIGPIQLLSGGSQTAADTLQSCLGSTLEFQIEAIDPDPADTLTLSSDIAQILPGATVSFSGTNPVIVDVSWTPDSSNINQSFAFVLDADDYTCPLPGIAQREFYIEVFTPCISAALTDIACQDSTGVIDVTVVGDSGASYTYLWSTGDTTEDVQGLPVGSYWVNVLDSTGQVFLTDTFFISATDLTLIPTFTIPNCAASDGEIDLTVTGGMMPYSYAWSNGSQMSTLSGVPAGGYSVTVTDVNGCPSYEVYFLDESDSCFVSVSGTAFHDLNGNCVQDSNELGIPYLFIELTPGGAIFTDQNGDYSMLLDTGSYVLEVQPPSGSYWFSACPANGQHSLNFANYTADTTGLDFAMDMPIVQDLRIAGGGYWSSFVPGFPVAFSLYFFNDGSQAMDVSWEWEVDSLLTYVGAFGQILDYDSVNHIVSGTYDSLLPGQQFGYNLFAEVDTFAMIGDTIEMIAQVMPILGDSTPDNNVFIDTQLVVASFDPNDKLVLPKGDGPEGFIRAEQNKMHYTVRFQNTGNFPAQFVVIRDTIHPNLDLTSYRPMTSSHAYTLHVEEDSILVFRFDNINLPDSATDPSGSQGHVSYQLQHEGILSPGDSFTNSAGIYFDFNAPVITGKVLNTIVIPTSVDAQVSSPIQVYPNPFSDQVSIHFPNPSRKSYQLVVMDVQGREVRHKEGIRSEEVILNRADLSRGMYLFHLSGEGKNYSGKLLIK